MRRHEELNVMQGCPAVVTIDVEPDNVWANPRSASLRNIEALPAFHAICRASGIKPTYLVTHSVVSDPAARSVVEGLLADGSAEIGAHPHLWEIPPADAVDARDAPVGNLYAAPALEEKLGSLTAALRSAFGPVTSHRAGRWGMDDRQLRALRSLGYVVDSSVTPGIDWTVTGAPDYSQEPVAPHVRADALTEVPCTIRAGRVWRAAGPRVRRLLQRAGLGAEWLRCHPSRTASDLLDVSAWAAAQRLPLVLMTHSSELCPGTSPMWPDAAHVDQHLQCYRDLFSAWAGAGVVPMTLTAYAASLAAGTPK